MGTKPNNIYWLFGGRVELDGIMSTAAEGHRMGAHTSFRIARTLARPIW